MFMKHLKKFLDAYFKTALLNSVFITSLIVGAGMSTLLICITLIIRNPSYAWWVVGGIVVFWIMVLMILKVCINTQAKKARHASNALLGPSWVGIAAELVVNYFSNKNKE